MNSSSQSFLNDSDDNCYSPNKATSLNPNATEFVPSSLRSLSGSNKKVDGARLDSPEPSGKAVFDGSESNSPNNSDDEARQYWQHRLPDDITPDFKDMGQAESQSPIGLSLARLSLNDGVGVDPFRVSTTVGVPFLGKRREISPRGSELVNLSEGTAYPIHPYTENYNSTTLSNLCTSLWDKQFMSGDQYSCVRESSCFGGNSSADFQENVLNENPGSKNAAVNFLASRFPGWPVERLAELYYGSECDLNLTIDRITRLELQVNNGLHKSKNSNTLSAPSLSALDFPTFSVTDSENGLSKYGSEDLQRAPSTFLSADRGGFSLLKSSMSDLWRDTPDFTSGIHRLASQDPGRWKYDMTGSMAVISSSRNSQFLGRSYDGHGKAAYADKLQGLNTVWATPEWLETGDAEAQMYSETRDGACNSARLRNASFEQAAEAYVTGNKALAKEPKIKGHLYSVQMKEAHQKAIDSVHRQRTPVVPELGSYDKVDGFKMNLIGLPLNEAICNLKYDLNILRRAARATGMHTQVMIRVGTGPHIQGSHTQLRLQVSVRQYLLDENFQFSEDQPGLLRVVIC